FYLTDCERASESKEQRKPKRERENLERERAMKITALLVLKCTGEGSDPVILVNASDVSHFGYFQRSSVREFIVFVGRTVAKRTPQGQRQSVQHEEYKVHSYNRNGLCALGFMDDHYPIRSAFSLLNQDPAEADKLLKIQRELDETKIILHQTIDSVLARGEKLDSLVEKSSDLSAASQ
ncbi:VAMP-like protein YKT61, partial [Mucuna pruriens]